MTNPNSAFLPIAFHFLVVPAVPEGADSLLDSNGQPVFTDYSTVDWAGLAKSARAHIDPYLPKAAQLYIGNDGPDLFDLHNLGLEDAASDQDDMLTRVLSVVGKATMKDMRAGIFRIAGPENSIHLNKAIGTRPPLTAVLMTLKFKDMSQAMDYLWRATKELFGHGYMQQTPKNPILEKGDGSGEMAPCVHRWFQEQFGAVYGTGCAVLILGVTGTD